MSRTGQGILAMVGACTVWGLSPLFYAQVAQVPPLEVLGHRVLWSLVFFAAFLGWQGRLPEVAQVFRTAKGWLMTGLATAMISVNWLLFISSVSWGVVRESALGYYIFPLLAVVIGVGLGERLRPLQWVAVALAVAAVTLLTVQQGKLPWIALALAISFAIYGLVKKGATAGPVVSVTAEVVLIVPLAAAFLVWQGALWDSYTMVILALSGPVTAVPLILFSMATKRVDLSTVGILQYLNPTLQFLSAVVVLAEPLTGTYLAAFGLIWLAVALYSGSALSRRSNASDTVSTKET